MDIFSKYKKIKKNLIIKFINTNLSVVISLDDFFKKKRGRFIIKVPLEKIRGMHELNFSYEIGGKHPFVNAIQQIKINNGNLTSEDSVLKKYYQIVQPRSIADLLDLGNTSASYARLSKISPLYSEFPWRGCIGGRKRSSEPDAREHGFHNVNDASGYSGYGPVSSELLNMEYERLLAIYNVVDKNQFSDKKSLPTLILEPLYDDREGKYAFQVLSGNHRLAAATCTGLENILCFANAGGIVLKSEAELWPGVVKGDLSIEDAIKIFDRTIAGAQPKWVSWPLGQL